MRNISISNVRAETRSIIPSIIAGLAESPIEDIRLDNITVYNPISVSADSLKSFPADAFENNKIYPENRLTFGTKLPSSAFYIKNVKGASLNDVSVIYREKDARPAIYLRDTRSTRSGKLKLTTGNWKKTNPSWWMPTVSIQG